MLGPALALGTSLGYGVGDFLGGTTSRRIGTLPFIFCAQLVMLVLAAGWVAVVADPIPPTGTLAAAAGAGLGMTVGLSAFFQAMAVGKMSLVAPISATGVAIPVAAGILGGEHPMPGAPIPNRFADRSTALASDENRSFASGNEPTSPPSLPRISSRTGSIVNPASVSTRPAIRS